MIQLLPFLPADFDRLIHWAHSEELLAQFAGPLFTYPLTHEQLHEYIQGANRIVYKVSLQPGEIVIGHAEIAFPDDKTAVLCRILVGEAGMRGKGIGLQIIEALLQVAFAKPAIEVVSLNVYDWNIPAIKCYQKAGFTINPFHRRPQTVGGQVWTALNMTLHRSATE